MNTFLILSLFVFAATVTSYDIPELHVINKVSFKYPYSCQPSPLSYEGCALFISDYGMSRNSPDLLYNGACGSDNYFNVMLAGDDFGMLSDLGDVPIENVTAADTFYDAMGHKNNQFTGSVMVVAGHTYAALLARRDVRALFVFRVESFERSGPAVIAYAVKQYGIIGTVQEAPGFSWTAPNVWKKFMSLLF